MNNSPETAWIVERASELGFDLCGVVRAEKFPELGMTEEWLARGYAGEMEYLTDQRRSNPQSVMPGLRSVIVCALNYNSPAPRSVDAHEPRREPPREAGYPAMPGGGITTKFFTRSCKSYDDASFANDSPSPLKHAFTRTPGPCMSEFLPSTLDSDGLEKTHYY